MKGNRDALSGQDSLLNRVITLLHKVSGPDNQGWYTALCPFHNDLHTPNLRFRETGFRCMACGQKGGLKKLAEKLGIQPIEVKLPARHIVDTYDYKDEKGILLFQVVRYEPKTFRQRRPNGAGGWIWTLEGVRRVLFLLPELLVSPIESPAFFPEGEKDVKALRSLGLTATCNPGGAGKFTIDMREPLKDRCVVVIGDKDEAGRRHAQQVAGLLHGFAASVKVIEMPGDQAKDAADWVAWGGTAEELLALADAAPYWGPPSGAKVLDAAVSFVRRFVVLTLHQAVAIALWTAHTHAFDFADATPYIHVTSPEKRCGKTRLLEVEELLVCRPWLTGRVTPAVLARKIDAECPTLLLDESDAAFKGDKEYAETLRAILNSGHRRGGKASVCVGQGANISFRDLNTFCPKMIAGIGKLPDTVADRSIPIVLKRRAPGENVDRFRRRKVEHEASELREKLAGWTSTLHLLDADLVIPEELDDRAMDGWEPLLALADAAGGDWPGRAREAALALSTNAGREDQSHGVQLLADIQNIFTQKGVAAIPSKTLVEALLDLEEAPWADMKKPLNTQSLASMLKPYDIHPKGIRLGTETPRGYLRTHFADAWQRYLPASPTTLSATGATLASTQLQNDICNTEAEPQRDVALSAQIRPSFNVADVADNKGGIDENEKLSDVQHPAREPAKNAWEEVF